MFLEIKSDCCKPQSGTESLAVLGFVISTLFVAMVPWVGVYRVLVDVTWTFGAPLTLELDRLGPHSGINLSEHGPTLMTSLHCQM